MFCVNCGTKLDEGTKFCPSCGTKVENQTASVSNARNEEVMAQPVAVVANESQTQTQNGSIDAVVQQPVSEKRRLTALLLCILLGHFGIHAFYLGKVGRGIGLICLYFFGLFFFGIGLDDNSIGLTLMGVCSLIVFFIMYIIDIKRIAKGKAVDSKGLPVTDWVKD